MKQRSLTRRELVALSAGAGALGVTAALALKAYYEYGRRAATFAARAKDYSASLAPVIRRGLLELGWSAARIRGKRVLLKPNLVEPDRAHTHINTHPLVVQAAIEAFRQLGAASVLVAEGAGHREDSILVLEESGLIDVLRDARAAFTDLNTDDLVSRPNTSGRTKLATLQLPASLFAADIVVSMPKMKTHHWAGVTLSMKNLFGIMPGRVYGWPKNVLHIQGIHQSIVDIYATARPHLAIVDGIVGMEGDGPIMGSPRHAGVIVIGDNFPAVDATCARIMGVDPTKIPYLLASSGTLGPIQSLNIQQRGEPLDALRTDFKLIDSIPAHQGLRL